MRTSVLQPQAAVDRKSTRLNSSHTVIYTLSLHDALPISAANSARSSLPSELMFHPSASIERHANVRFATTSGRRSEEHTSELQSHRDLHSFPTRRSSDLSGQFGKIVVTL